MPKQNKALVIYIEQFGTFAHDKTRIRECDQTIWGRIVQKTPCIYYIVSSVMKRHYFRSTETSAPNQVQLPGSSTSFVLVERSFRRRSPAIRRMLAGVLSRLHTSHGQGQEYQGTNRSTKYRKLYMIHPHHS